MATKISAKKFPREKRYEPGFEFNFGITDETTDTKLGTLTLTYFPPKSKSRSHIHTNGDLVWYCISGKCIWISGKDKKEYVMEPGDFLYIPRGEVHQTINPSDTEPVEGLGGYFGCSNPYKSGKVETPFE